MKPASRTLVLFVVTWDTVGGPLERFGPQRIAALMPQMRAILQPLQQHCRHVPAAPVIIEAD